jgi:aldose 1-epimerase
MKRILATALTGVAALVVLAVVVGFAGAGSPRITKQCLTKKCLKPPVTQCWKHQEPSITKELFGNLDGGVYRYTLTNSSGMKVMILNYGGIIQQVWVPDKDCHMANVTLGYAKLTGTATDSYVGSNNSTYFGALIGRYGNRIGKGQFDLNGTTYQLSLNNGANTLHGGYVGFDKKMWDVTKADVGPNGPELGLHLFSPDQDEHYPADLNVNVTYTLTKANQIKIDYSATNQSATLSTVVNLTNHAYWNLAGDGSGTIYDHVLTIPAKNYTPVDSGLIPTGVIAPVAGTPFDFTTPHAIGQRIRDASSDQIVLGRGYDHNFVLDKGTAMGLAAHVWEPTSGRTLDIITDQPGVQFYAGNFLDGTLVGTSGMLYRQGDGFALETQHFPDSPNHSNFPSTVLGPGNTLTSETIYQFGVGNH